MKKDKSISFLDLTMKNKNLSVTIWHIQKAFSHRCNKKLPLLPSPEHKNLTVKFLVNRVQNYPISEEARRK
jgi:hypothetical protein